VLALVASVGASAGHLDSQYVLQRYALALVAATAPKVVVFSYTRLASRAEQTSSSTIEFIAAGSTSGTIPFQSTE